MSKVVRGVIHKEFFPHQGDIFFVDLGEGVGSVQKGRRPCMIIQNNIGNKFSPTYIVVCLTKQVKIRKNGKLLPTQMLLHKEETGLDYDSVICFEQIRTVSKEQLKEKVGFYPFENLLGAFMASFGLQDASL